MVAIGSELDVQIVLLGSVLKETIDEEIFI